MVAALALAAALLASATPAVQRRPADAPAPANAVTASIALTVGALSYDAAGAAACRHAPQASIYDAPAELWSVQQASGSDNLSLTVWRPRSGGESMLTLALSAGGKRYDVSTVTVGGRGQTTGSGTVTFTREGKGGAFTIRAKAGNGAAISGIVRCSAFTPLVAEGGDD